MMPATDAMPVMPASGATIRPMLDAASRAVLPIFDRFLPILSMPISRPRLLNDLPTSSNGRVSLPTALLIFRIVAVALSAAEIVITNALAGISSPVDPFRLLGPPVQFSQRQAPRFARSPAVELGEFRDQVSPFASAPASVKPPR